MPIKRELSGDALTATVRLQARGPLSKADVAELRRETDAWGLEARLRSYEQSARTVLERAGYRTDIPWSSFRSLVADEDSKERLAAWILWRIGLLRQTKADLSDCGAVSIRNTWWEKITLAALDVQVLVDVILYG
jgi:hypothetical protein